MRIIHYILIISLSLAACKSSKETVTESNDTVETVKNVKEVDANVPGDVMGEEPMPIFSDSVFAQIQRTPCFGRCGIYTLTVFKSGLLRYKGEKWVEKEGLYEVKVEQEKLDLLLEKANEVKFFEMKNTYDNKNVTDLPSTITSVRNSEGIKTVVNRYDGPKELSEFEKYFESLFEAEAWEKISSKTN